MIYKTLKKVSDVCQVLDKRKYKTETDRGVTFTNNGDGSITVNGTPTGSYYSLYTISIKLDVIIPGHKYAILVGRDVYDKLTCGLLINHTGAGGYVYKWGNNIYSVPEYKYTRCVYEIRANLGYTYSNVLVKPQLFDLTEMYGAGNEPATVEEFKSKFPNDLYDYSPRCFVTSYKDCLKVNDVCQLMVYPYFETTLTRAGITFTDNGDGTITANGTSVGFATFIFSKNFNFTAGNKYYVSTPYSIIAYKENGTIKYAQGNILFTWKSNWETVQVYMQINKGITVSNLTFKPQLFDLTEMYGAGNEPTTVEQFRADFPDELYDYKPYSIVPSYKKSLACKTKNLFYNNQVYNIKGSLDEIIWRGEISAQCYFSWYQSLNSLKNPSAALFTFNYSDGSVSYAVAKNELISRGRVHINSSVSKKLTSIVLCNWCYANGSIYNLQLELGDTATEYHPYGYL